MSGTNGRASMAQINRAAGAARDASEEKRRKPTKAERVQQVNDGIEALNRLLLATALEGVRIDLSVKRSKLLPRLMTVSLDGCYSEIKLKVEDDR